MGIQVKRPRVICEQCLAVTQIPDLCVMAVEQEVVVKVDGTPRLALCYVCTSCSNRKTVVPHETIKCPHCSRDVFIYPDAKTTGGEGFNP